MPWVAYPRLPVVSKHGLFEPFYVQKPTFCQDRLGTNIGKARNKRTVLPQDRALKVLSGLKLLRESPTPSASCPPGADAEAIIAGEKENVLMDRRKTS